MDTDGLQVTEDGRPTLDWLPADSLVVDRAYQRDLTEKSWTKIRRIGREFTWAKFGALVVAGPDRLGDYHILDGQHRWEAAKALGLGRLPCVIVPIEDRAGEAHAFVAINRERSQVTPLHMFHAAVAAGEPDKVAIAKLLEEAGLKVARHPQETKRPRRVTATAALSACYKSSPDALARGLKILAEAQGEVSGGLRGQTIKAVVWLLAAHGDAIDEARLIKSISADEVDFDSWLETARTTRQTFGGKTEIALQAMIVQAYNKGLREGSRLPMPRIR